ncbi:alpha/beta hydrolase family protein [Mycobacterium kyorinense]|nr:alpha/beta fold hydrolase [Mycobacterium kyorinense]
MVTDNAMPACVLVLPGGEVRSERAFKPWRLASLRMMFVARALRRRLGRQVEVRQVRYRVCGWNSPRLDPVQDAKKVLDDVQGRFQPERIALVGHSMGGRVAAHLAAGGGVGAVVALAPWWAGQDGDLIPASTRLLVVHGTADTTTDPADSQAQTKRACRRGLDAQWVALDGVGHHMVRRWRDWHLLTTKFVAEHLAATAKS